MGDHLTDEFLQEVVDHLVAAGFAAVNEHFNYTFHVDLFQGRPVRGSRSVLFGLANPTWGGSVTYCEGYSPDGDAQFQPDETDRGYVDTFILDSETDPKVVAAGIAIGLIRYAIEVDPATVERAIRLGEAYYDMERSGVAR